MNKIAKFHKVSENQFNEAFKAQHGTCPNQGCYDKIKMPRRATVGSAGYDFYAPFDFTLNPGEEITVPTGIRAEIDMGYVLMLYPRSGLGFKYRLTLNNTVGVIDSDYFHSDNEGHIFCKITCDAKEEKEVLLKKGSAFVQGIFLEYGITFDDEVTELRNGGFGSTNK